jgi:outer membrane protein assembly factor BamB
VVDDPDGSGPVVYLGTDPPSGPGAEYAIYGPGNKHGSCRKDWKFGSWAISDGGTWSPPAYATDATGRPLLVFGSVDPDDAVYALNANTGAEVWRDQVASGANADVGAAPAISPPGQNGFKDGVVYAVDKAKVVDALNLTTGAPIWNYHLTKTKNASLSSSALDGNVIYLGSNDGVYAINATTGRRVWHVLQGPTFYASPAIAGPAGQQVLVIGDNAGRLYALNLATGATVWTTRPITAGFWASPAISQGTIYIAGLDGVLRSYQPAGS